MLKFGRIIHQLQLKRDTQWRFFVPLTLFFMVSNSVSASYVFNFLLPNDVETRKIAPSRPFSPSNNSAEVPGDGRCLFRSVAHGACLRSGHPSPSHAKQKQLADDLRAKVVDEFIKRRADTEWFLEGDFDAYTGQMRKPHIWGGEPELLMSSHVLQMPITVVMEDKKSGRLQIIAEYGQEYGKDCPIQVIYHGYGHYDVLNTSPTSAYSHPTQHLLQFVWYLIFWCHPHSFVSPSQLQVMKADDSER